MSAGALPAGMVAPAVMGSMGTLASASLATLVQTVKQVNSSIYLEYDILRDFPFMKCN